MLSREVQLIEPGYQNDGKYVPYIMLKPYFVRYMNILTNSLLNRFDLKIQCGYKVKKWSFIAKEIYKPTIQELGKNFETGLYGHIEVVKSFWKDEAIIVFFRKSQNDKRDFNKILSLKNYVRKNLPGGPQGKDYIFLGNINEMEIPSEIKKRISVTYPYLGKEKISQFKGRWDYFFFKYIHCPDSVKKCQNELQIYQRNKIFQESNYISKDDLNIMIECGMYTLPKDIMNRLKK